MTSQVYPPKSPWREEEYTPPVIITQQLPAATEPTPPPRAQPEAQLQPRNRGSFRKFIAETIVAEWLLFVNGFIMMMLVAAEVNFDARRLMFWWGYLLMLLPIVSCAFRRQLHE
jgi:hypothetical protein